MITTTVLAILGAILLLVLYQMMKAPAAGKPLPAPSPMPAVAGPAGIDLYSARSGDVISVHGAAADFSDVDFTVDRRSRYETAGRKWIDLSGEFRGNRVYLEVERAAEMRIMGILDPRRLTIADLGLTEDRLAELDQRQDPNQTIPFEGKTWRYDSSREIGYFEGEMGDGEGLYRWLFREQGGDRLLCIEKWEGEPFDVRIARQLNPRDITVFRAA